MKWSELQNEFRRVVLQRGAKTLSDVADDAGIGRDTVHRIMSGRVVNPHKSVRHCVERYVSESDIRRSTDDS